MLSPPGARWGHCSAAIFAGPTAGLSGFREFVHESHPLSHVVTVELPDDPNGADTIAGGNEFQQRVFLFRSQCWTQVAEILTVSRRFAHFNPRSDVTEEFRKPGPHAPCNPQETIRHLNRM